MQYTFQCRECKTDFKVPLWRFKRGITKYCSIHCRQTGIARRPVTWGDKIAESHKGNKCPWNVERNKKYKTSGEKHHLWKGNNVGYHALHNWVKRNFQLPKECAQCGAKKNLHLSNISHLYKREEKDWWILCASCHQKYDNKHKKNNGLVRMPYRWKKENPQ